MQKHKSEDPNTLRAMYYPNLRMYSTHGDTSHRKAPMDAALAFLFRFGRRAALSLAIYMLSYLPIIGRFILPAASYYTFNKAVGPVPATLIFGTGIFLPRRYLVMFLQSYFSSRSLMRELVRSNVLYKCNSWFVGTDLVSTTATYLTKDITTCSLLYLIPSLLLSLAFYQKSSEVTKTDLLYTNTNNTA